MAEKRMFSKTIIDSDAFLDMPLSTQALYFHLSMRADDDGFVGNPQRINKLIGANKNDFDILILKRYIIPFESGVVVIKHWRINNLIRSDRYKETNYIEEKSKLLIKDNEAYTEKDNLGIPNDNQRLPQVSIGKSSIDKNRLLKDVSAPTEPPFIILPAIRNDFEVSYEYLKELKETYQAVDVEQQLKEMKMWLDSNPSKKKVNTKSFITRWLGEEQDKGIVKVKSIKSQPIQNEQKEVSEEDWERAIKELKERENKNG